MAKVTAMTRLVPDQITEPEFERARVALIDPYADGHCERRDATWHGW